MLNARFLTLAGMIFLAAASRLMPHPPNFTPLGAMALFAGACFTSRRAAFAVPLAALFLSDLALAATTDYGWAIFRSQPAVYFSFALIVCLGFLLRRRQSAPVRVLAVGAASLASSLLFYLVTNFAVWAGGSLRELYEPTLAGLVQCYVAGLPFFRQTVLGDLLYTAVLFAGFAVAQAGCRPLRQAQSPATDRGASAA